jgi:molybdopterin/thiamine biosynthesis adenylyltransferase
MTKVEEKYIRQIQIPQIGMAGHEKIRQSTILIVGAGGLGIPVAQYLASSGVGKIGIIDHDIVAMSNLGRQIIYGKNDIGKRKSLLLCERLSFLHPEVQFIPYEFSLEEQNAEEIMKSYQLIINATDSFQTRYLINTLCLKLNLPWINLAATHMEGQITNFQPQNGCYECLFPNQKEKIPTQDNCSTQGIIAPICGMMGSWGAQLALMIQVNLLPDTNFFYRYDGMQNHFQKYAWKKNPQCPTCSKEIFFQNSNKKNQFEKIELPQNNHVTLEKILDWVNQKEHVIFINLDPWGETKIHLERRTNAKTATESKDQLTREMIKIPLEDFFSKDFEDPAALQLLTQHAKIICLCPHGIKSKIAADILQKEGYQSYTLN